MDWQSGRACNRFGMARTDRKQLMLKRPFLRFTKMAPFATVVRQAAPKPSHRAALHLPSSCEVWSQGDLAVYDIPCVGDSLSSG